MATADVERRARDDERDRELVRVVRGAGVDAAGLRVRRDALARLLAPYEPMVRVTVRAVLGRRFTDQDRDDVCQVVWRDLVEYVIERTGEPESFRAIVRGRARWAALDVARGRGGRAREMPSDRAEERGGREIDADGMVDAIVIRDFVETLNERDRTLFRRRNEEGVPSKQVAAELGMTVQAVDTQNHRLCRRLQELLRDG